MRLKWHHIGRVNFERVEAIIKERSTLRLPSLSELQNDFLSDGDEQWVQHPSWYWSSEERINLTTAMNEDIRREWVVVYKGNTSEYNNEVGHIDRSNKDYECFLSLVEEVQGEPLKIEAAEMAKPATTAHVHLTKLDTSEVPEEIITKRAISQHIIEVHIEDGIVFKYRVNSPQTVIEHMSRIITKGYRRNDGKIIEHYPPHRILKVKSENIPKNLTHVGDDNDLHR